MKALLICFAILLAVSACQTTSKEGIMRPHSAEHLARLETHLKQAIKAERFNGRLREKLAIIKYLQNEYAEAESSAMVAHAFYVAQRADKYPDITRVALLLAVSKSQQGKFSEALPLLRRAVRIAEEEVEPEDPCLNLLHGTLAEILQELKQNGEADMFFARADSVKGKCQSLSFTW